MGGRRKSMYLLAALLAVLALAGYLTIYAVVRRQHFQESFLHHPEYTLLYEEEASPWLFLYAYYPVIWIDRRLFAHATEIVGESRNDAWSNR